jgi:hypothetical protein
MIVFSGAARRRHGVLMIARGDSLPHFEVTQLDGRPASYATIWQRHHLVLVLLPGRGAESREYAALLHDREPEFSEAGADVVATAEPVADLAGPAVVVADRWGEVQFAAAMPRVAELPPVEDLLEWVRYVQQRCPECEGEAK